MSEFDTTIPLDAEVYAVVFSTKTVDGMSDIVMPEVAKSRQEALKHWRFNAAFLTKDEIRNTRSLRVCFIS